MDTLSPKSGDQLTDSDIADIIDAAAQLIADHGLYRSDLWPSSMSDYQPGQPCCVVGAIGVAAGHTSARSLEVVLIGFALDEDEAEHPETEPHPILAAVMAQLSLDDVPDMFAWSDGSNQHAVIARLREAAAAIRARGDR